MIAGILHKGSGLGNQLFRYIATRVLAEDKGYEFGIVNPEGFKGKSFIDLNMGKEVPGTFHVEQPTGKVIPEGHGLSTFSEKSDVQNGLDIRGYDPEWENIPDNTLIDGEFQAPHYFIHKLRDIDLWLRVRYLGMPNNLCVIGFRGGEFTVFPDLYLTKEYWDMAIERMRQINPEMVFVCVTDDPVAASQMLPGFVKISHEISTDWRMIRHARYLILSNSSFYILPALLNNNAREIIAPRFWARRSSGGPWATPQNCYSQFTYI